MQVAITCIANDLLRTVASIALRHAGYRVKDTETSDAAIAAAERTRPDFVVIGVLADPAGQLAAWCKDRSIQFRIVSPQISIAELKEVLDTLPQTRERLSNGK